MVKPNTCNLSSPFLARLLQAESNSSPIAVRTASCSASIFNILSLSRITSDSDARLLSLDLTFRRTVAEKYHLERPKHVLAGLLKVVHEVLVLTSRVQTAPLKVLMKAVPEVMLLSLVYSSISALHGTVDHYSVPGKQTTYAVTLIKAAFYSIHSNPNQYMDSL